MTDDRLQIVRRLLAALTRARTPDDFCDALANDVLTEHQVAATYLARLAQDGRVTMVGSWGYPPSRRASDDRPSLWYPMAITDTIRTGTIHVFETWEEYTVRYPHLAHRASPGVSFVCVPFSADGRRTGGLGLTFNVPLHEVRLDSVIWEIIAEAGNALIHGAWAHDLFAVDRGGSVLDRGPDHHMQIKQSLTEREIQVLALSADGLTAKEIASRLFVSESTVKQTRMSLYRKLDAHNREDLRHAARIMSIDSESVAPMNHRRHPNDGPPARTGTATNVSR